MSRAVRETDRCGITGRSDVDIPSPDMRGHDVGPRRSQSVDALVRGTRVLAVVALLALVGGIVSDVVGGSFWAWHALLAGIAASVIVVMLSVAVINELLERRTERPAHGCKGGGEPRKRGVIACPNGVAEP